MVFLISIRSCRLWLSAGLFFVGLWGTRAPAHGDGFSRLTALSLEELMNVEVTLASRKKERLFETAAAVFVLTNEDIRRSGATSIPEVLRLVPGVQVARLGASRWAVSARGFNDRFAQKLLVLIDGRSIYSSQFSGVYWETRDVMLEDVDRIEVIRGPGATLWGANAVNGIINIVTRNTQDTRGGLATFGAGTEERGFGAVRYGGALGDRAGYRVYGKFFLRDHFVNASGKPAADDWETVRAGFRYDGHIHPRDTLTVQGELYAGETGQVAVTPTVTPPFERIVEEDTRIRGGHVQTRWRHRASNASSLTVQFYYDQSHRGDTLGTVNRKTYDLDFQHQFSPGGRHEIVYGLGYRFVRDETMGSFKIRFDPADRSTRLFSAFLQDDIDLVTHRLTVTLGSKFEHNAYTGFEYQPNFRLLWTPGLRQTVWASATRAVRTPSRADTDMRLAFGTFPFEEFFPDAQTPGPPILVIVSGKPDFRSEILRAFELGYRIRPASGVFFDATGFYNRYKNLRAARLGDPEFNTESGVLHIVAPVIADNLQDGTTYGFEVAADWQLADRRVRLRAAYAFLGLDLHLRPEAIPGISTVDMGSPKYQAHFQASLTPGDRTEFDGVLRYVSRLPGIGVKSYLELDLRLGWRPAPQVEVSVTGQNLFHGRHAEFEDLFFGSPSTRTQRGVYSAISWRF